jgi:hypothetical protein
MPHPPDERVDSVYERLRDVDPDTLDAEGLTGFVADVARLKAWCDARQVVASRRQRALAAEGRAADPRDTLSRHGRQSGRDASAAAERETVCTAMPGFEQALAEGDVSSGHVDAIASATRHLDETARSEFAGHADDLLAAAARQGVDTFGRSCRDLARHIRNQHDARSAAAELERQHAASKITRWVDRDTGMHKTLIEMDPLSDRRFWSSIQRQRNQIRARTTNRQTSWDRLGVDALLEAVEHESTTGTNRSGRVPTVSVHVGLDQIMNGAVGLCETDDGNTLPVETVRRLACDADIIPIVLDGRGVVLDQGRAKRLATSDQRTALEAMHRTCSHPDCTVTIDDCRIHHLDPWQHGGRTDLDRLAPLCEHHHHLVHEGGWGFDLTHDRHATWTRPDGTLHWSGPINDRHG